MPIALNGIILRTCLDMIHRTSRPQARLEAIQKLSQAGIPVGVMMAPLIPGLTDHEIPALLHAAKKAGAQYANFVSLRLPLTVRPIFEEWLEIHKKDRKEKILNRVLSMRGGKLNDSRFGSRMRGEGAFADQISSMFKIYCKKEGLSPGGPTLSTSSFQRVNLTGQLALF